MDFSLLLSLIVTVGLEQGNVTQGRPEMESNPSCVALLRELEQDLDDQQQSESWRAWYHREPCREMIAWSNVFVAQACSFTDLSPSCKEIFTKYNEATGVCYDHPSRCEVLSTKATHSFYQHRLALWNAGCVRESLSATFRENVDTLTAIRPLPTWKSGPSAQCRELGRWAAAAEATYQASEIYQSWQNEEHCRAWLSLYADYHVGDCEDITPSARSAECSALVAEAHHRYDLCYESPRACEVTLTPQWEASVRVDRLYQKAGCPL